jgi:hypothetical protein
MGLAFQVRAVEDQSELNSILERAEAAGLGCLAIYSGFALDFASISLMRFRLMTQPARGLEPGPGERVPGHLLEAFDAAVSDAVRNDRDWVDAFGDVTLLSEYGKVCPWEQMRGVERGAWLCDQLWNCGEAFSLDDMPSAHTYGQAARIIKRQLGPVLRLQPSAPRA